MIKELIKGGFMAGGVFFAAVFSWFLVMEYPIYTGCVCVLACLFYLFGGRKNV